MLSYCLKSKKNAESKNPKVARTKNGRIMLLSKCVVCDHEKALNLRQPGFTYSACGPFIKNKERIQKFKDTGHSRYIYQKELDKACFQHDMAYGNFKYLTRRTVSDKIWRDKAFNITKNPKYDGYQRGLASMVYRCFGKKTSGSGVKNENISNKELAEELHKPIITKFKKRKLHSPFIDNIWGANLADMQLISKFNKII